jgi:hypothetical protein
VHRTSAPVLLALGILFAAAAARAQEPGKELYKAACAACHGPDGRGMPRSAVGFDVPIPDFTDCSFATPEADADWLAVSHSGGPARAFDRRMPAFGEALTEAELRGILAHIRGFCTSSDWPRGELNLPRALLTEKAFPENEAVLTTTFDTSDRAAISNVFLYEQRLGARSQFEVVVPIDLRERASGGWERGLGDLAVAVKRALFHSLERGAILSVAAEVIFPTGKEDAGLGSGVTKFEPFVAFGQILPRDSFLQFQGGIELSSDSGRAAHEAFWRTALGRTLSAASFGRAWSPMVEVLGARELDTGAGVEWSVVPQVQVSLSRRQHVLLNVGVQVPVNDREERGTRVLTYLLWDWFDGGLFSGWR